MLDIQMKSDNIFKSSNFFVATIVFFLLHSEPIKGDTVSSVEPANIQGSTYLRKLEDGNKRYVSGKVITEKNSSELRRELTKGQKPFAAVLSCSDSRVPPEYVFDQSIGDLFAVRTAGHVLDNAAIASLEYAVEHLHVSVVLIMGHEKCGAVKSALEAKEGVSSGSYFIDKLISQIRPSLAGFREAKWSPDLRGPVKANINSVAKQLVKKSEIVREHLFQKKIQLITGIYTLEQGIVEFNNWDMELFGFDQTEKSSILGH